MNFDRLASCYRILELVLAGGSLQRMRTRWMGEVAGCSRILIIGEGHGRGVEAVLRASPDATITIVEKSPRMLAVAQARLRRKGLDTSRIECICSDVRAWSGPRATFDVIMTQFVLDCFTPEGVSRVVAQLAHSARSDARWLLSDFRIPEHGWRRTRARVIHAIMYRCFRWATALEARQLTRPDHALRSAGFSLERRSLSCAGLLHTDLWSRRCSGGLPEIAGVEQHL